MSPAVFFGLSPLSAFLFSPCVAPCACCCSHGGLGHKTQVLVGRVGGGAWGVCVGGCGRQLPCGNLLRALLNKVFKYYPKLKDIHTCLQSLPPLSLSSALSLPLWAQKQVWAGCHGDRLSNTTWAIGNQVQTHQQHLVVHAFNKNWFYIYFYILWSVFDQISSGHIEIYLVWEPVLLFHVTYLFMLLFFNLDVYWLETMIPVTHTLHFLFLLPRLHFRGPQCKYVMWLYYDIQKDVSAA